MSPSLSRDEAAKRIRAGLRRRTGKDWSVTVGRGTTWGWITVESPPRRQVDWEGHPTAGGGAMSEAERKELAAALGLPAVHHQGVSIPGQSDYYAEYVDRAEGRKPAVIGKPNW
jgi:hypothetical protein